MSRLGAKLVSTVILIAVCGPANSQNLGQSIGDAMRRTSDLLQGEENSGRTRATTDIRQTPAKPAHAQTAVTPSANAEPRKAARPVPALVTRQIVARDHGSLSGIAASAYKMRNDLVLETSGDFKPDGGTVCTAHCR